MQILKYDLQIVCVNISKYANLTKCMHMKSSCMFLNYKYACMCICMLAGHMKRSMHVAICMSVYMHITYRWGNVGVYVRKHQRIFILPAFN